MGRLRISQRTDKKKAESRTIAQGGPMRDDPLGDDPSEASGGQARRRWISGGALTRGLAWGKVTASRGEYDDRRQRFWRRLLCCLMMMILCAVLMRVWFGRAPCAIPDAQQPARATLDYDPAWFEEQQEMSTKLGKPLADILSLEWNARPVAIVFSDRREVAAFVDCIEVEGKELLTGRELPRLRRAVTEFLFCNGTNDRKSYYRHLLLSREGLDEVRLKGIWALALQHDQPDILNLEPLDQLTWYCQEVGLQTHWRGLVAEGTRMKVFVTRTTNLPRAGLALEKILGRGLPGIKKTDPPITLEDAVRSRGSILIADLEVFVADDQGQTAPYWGRYWYDADSIVWRLAFVTGYSPCAGPPRDIIY